MTKPPETQPSFAFPDSFGYCGGVAAADELLLALGEEGQANSVPVYGFHEIVHNDAVVRRHKENGVVFVDDLSSVPPGSAVAISAHGASPEIFHRIKAGGSEPVDATCPLVTHAHQAIQKARERSEKVLYVCKGKPGEVPKLHDEVAGAVGHMDYVIDDEGELRFEPVDRSFLELGDDLDKINGLFSSSARYRLVTQTTLHADDCLEFREEVKEYIQARQPEAVIKWSNARTGEVCRAVANRQDGVAQLVQIRPKRIVVVTDPKSKNGMGYAALAKDLVTEKELDTEVVAIANGEEAAALEPTLGTTAITASASTPRESITEVVQALGGDEVPTTDDRVFHLPDATRIPTIISKLAKLRDAS